MIKLLINLFFIIVFSFNGFSQKISEKDLIAKANSSFYLIEQNSVLCIKQNLSWLEIAKKNNYKKCIALCLNNIAGSFAEMEVHEKSLEYSIEAEKISREVSDDVNLVEALRNQAILHARIGSFSEGLKMLDEALTYAEKIKDTDKRNISIGNVHIMRGNVYYYDDTVSKDSCVKYDRKSLLYYNKIKNDSIRISLIDASYGNLGEDYLLLKKLDSAEINLMKGLKYAIESKAVYTETMTLHNLADLYKEKGDIDKSLRFHFTAMDKAIEYNQLRELRNIYSDMAELYEEKGDTENAKLYLLKYKSTNDSLINLEAKQMGGILNSMISKGEVHYKEGMKKSTKILSLTIILTTIIIIIAIILFTKFKKEKEKRIKNEEVFNERLNDFAKNGNDIDYVKKESYEEIITLSIENSPLFLEKFKALFPEFIEGILKIAPTLNKTDLHFCALLKLGFATKEIATYTNTSVRSVEAKKYRLRKKLNIPAEEVISSWMINF